MISEVNSDPAKATSVAKIVDILQRDLTNSPNLDEATELAKILTTTLPVLDLQKFMDVLGNLNSILSEHKLDVPNGNEAPNTAEVSDLLMSTLQSINEKEGPSKMVKEIAKVLGRQISKDPLSSELDSQIGSAVQSVLTTEAVRVAQSEVPLNEDLATASR